MIKEVKEIVKILKKDDWVIISQKKHIKMRHHIYGTQTIPKTPKELHWKKNLMKQIEHSYKEHGASLV